MGASELELKRLFKRKLRETHPDLNPESQPEEAQKIIEAYRILGDKVSREEYDRELLEETAKKTAVSNRSKLEVDMDADSCETVFCPQCGEDNGNITEFEEGGVYDCVACSSFLEIGN